MNYFATIDTCFMQLFVVPTVSLLLFVVALCREVYKLCLVFRGKIVDRHGFEILARIACVLMFGTLVLISCHNLKRGVCLPFEDEKQAVSLTGTVDYIEQDKLSPRFFPSLGTGERYSCGGGLMVIDGEEYYCLSTRGWKKGDMVSVSFLPKSRIILRCEIIPGNET
jgi:hypothetical protein